MRFRQIVLVSLFLLAAGALRAADEPTEPEKDIGLGMVISGGVSLGAYEAGYNWALIRIFSSLREMQLPFHVELKSVAGASAGSINALLAGAYWCQRPDRPEKNRVGDNLFFDTWVNLGMRDLTVLPDNRENKSTLFSRRVLKKKAEAIIRHLYRPIYRKGCEVPLGFAVTKATPIIEEFEGIEIQHQAFSIPLTLKVENHQVTFENRKVEAEGMLKFLEIPGIEKSRKKILPVLFASSAFPGAFEQVKLTYR